jgi:acyl transferase domain-containing protein
LPADVRGATEKLAAPAVAQAALFAVGYAPSRLWMHWGVTRPSLSEGTGELVAAVVAGVFQVRDAIALAVRRAQLPTNTRADADALAAAVRRAERKTRKVARSGIASMSPPPPIVSRPNPPSWAKTFWKMLLAESIASKAVVNAIPLRST